MCYYLTYNKHKIYPTDIIEDDICLDDIAHHLTNINRYGGALPLGVTYSVAQHSICLADYVYEKTHDKQYAALALLHDASEAYLGDLVSGLKPILKDYVELEEYVQNLIYKKYNIKMPEVFHYTLSGWDKSLVLDEVLAIMPGKYPYYEESTQKQPLNIKINLFEFGSHYENQQNIKKLFLNKCKEYEIKENNNARKD